MENKFKNMNAESIVILMTVGLAAGILSGLVGVGGGIIIVPALVFLSWLYPVTGAGDFTWLAPFTGWHFCGD